MRLLMLALTSFWERTVSKRRIQTRHRLERDALEDVLVIAIEQAVAKGKLQRNTANWFYRKGDMLGLKGLKFGFDASFGKPWYQRMPIDLDHLKRKLKFFRRFKEPDYVNTPLSVLLERHRINPAIKGDIK